MYPATYLRLPLTVSSLQDMSLSRPIAAATCNCLNGICGANGECACIVGSVKADNGTACAKCDSGFFQTSTGDCKLCQLGCDRCADGTGVCLACKSGFTQDVNDRTKCPPVPTSTSSGTICPQGVQATSRMAPHAPLAHRRARAAREARRTTAPSARQIRSRSTADACARALPACVRAPRVSRTATRIKRVVQTSMYDALCISRPWDVPCIMQWGRCKSPRVANSYLCIIMTPKPAQDSPACPRTHARRENGLNPAHRPTPHAHTQPSPKVAGIQPRPPTLASRSIQPSLAPFLRS
ncbi:hypothetical protein BDN71DRAFT_1249007 [Pleurotus eryngii]|uniref:Laminin EGF-like domain-containing protein n=1 Tax=Pleurotus eryngii TaxID=5323 RepID=A0A9P5ZR22_PLEER|nr:hypothetical protein BDN71DRAFT_1249007 [Pleurotus eryngii]